MTEKEFRKAWGLEGSQVSMDIAQIPAETVEDAMAVFWKTGYLIAHDPHQAATNEACVSIIHKTSGTPIADQIEAVAKYYGGKVLVEGDMPPMHSVNMPYLRRKFMLQEPMTQQELYLLNEYD